MVLKVMQGLYIINRNALCFEALAGLQWRYMEASSGLRFKKVFRIRT